MREIKLRAYTRDRPQTDMKNTYPIHPLAAAFPEMAAEEFADLKASIKDHGLRHPVVLLEGQILDGRNRDAACVELKIPPFYREYDPAIDGDVPVAFVADENLNRRNLTIGQRAAIAAELEPYFAEAIKAAKAKKAAERKAAKDAKDKAAADAEAERKRTADELAKSMQEPLDQSAPKPPEGGEGYDQEEGEFGPDDGIEVTEAGKTAAGAAADAVGVSERSVHDAKSLKDKAPGEFEKVKTGEKTLNQAKADAAAQGESISPYRAECADMLEASQGEEFSQAIRDCTVLKTTAELEAFMRLTVPEQKEVVPYVCKGWKVADAVKFLKGEFNAGSTVGELMSYANAKGGDVTVEVGEFSITITAKKA